jgi:hypothetical protein
MKASNLTNHLSFKIHPSEGESYLYRVPKLIMQFVHADVNTKFTGNTENV